MPPKMPKSTPVDSESSLSQSEKVEKEEGSYSKSTPVVPEPFHIMATTSEPPAAMDVTPQSSAITDSTPVFPVIVNVAFEDTQAFQRHLGLISSLANPPLILARAAAIP